MENNDADLISSLSDSSSRTRTEHMKYLTNVLGLDRGTAALEPKGSRKSNNFGKR